MYDFMMTSSSSGTTGWTSRKGARIPLCPRHLVFLWQILLTSSTQLAQSVPMNLRPNSASYLESPAPHWWQMKRKDPTDCMLKASSALSEAATTLGWVPVSNLFTNRAERECIFPFYYEGKLYTECDPLEELDFVYPVFSCPVRNISTKLPWTDPATGQVKMINSFPRLRQSSGYCVIDPPDDAPEGTLVTLNPADDSCPSFFRVPPFSTCKNDCPGGNFCQKYSVKCNDFFTSSEFWHHRGRRCSVRSPSSGGTWCPHSFTRWLFISQVPCIESFYMLSLFFGWGRTD